VCVCWSANKWSLHKVTVTWFSLLRNAKSDIEIVRLLAERMKL
jgi:hypothetical protein